MRKYSLNNFHPVHQEYTHIGLVPDGTRGWATKNNVGIYDAYLFTFQKLANAIDFFFLNGYSAVSVYFSSEQNLNRPPEKVTAFCTAQAVMCDTVLLNLANKYAARVIPAGTIELVPQDLQHAVEKVANATAHHNKFRIYICIAYNPLREVIYAMNKSNNDLNNFFKNLWVPEPLDLVIRTANSNLLSNFLPLQAGYARIYTLKKVFPDVELEDYELILNKFKKLKRRFGT